MKDPTPPRLLEFLLRWRLPPEDRDAIAGDMAELYAARSRRYGRWRAHFWYARHAVRFVLTLVWTGRGAKTRWSNGPREGRGGIMTGWGTEVFRVARRLAHAPVFAVVSILTIGVGIGAFASIYSVVDTVLIEPPNYAKPDQLVWVWRDYWFGLHRGWLGGPDIVKLREHDDVFAGVVAFRTGGRNLTGRTGDNPERVRYMAASADLFDVLGVQPALGRGFQPEEEAPDAAGVAVLGWDLWQSHFGGDAGVLGREIYLDGEATRVVGVAPKDFRFVKHASLGPPEGGDLYVPLRMDLAALDPRSGMFAGLARVRDGITADQADAAIHAVADDLDAIFDHRGLKLRGIGLQEDLIAGVRPTLYTLLAAAAFLLLVLGANLTTLLLGRAGRRDRELAVRAALGAGRARLLQSVVAESLLLAVVGGAVGIGIAYGGVKVIRALAPDQLPRAWGIEVDPSVLGVSILATLAMGLVAGLLPAFRALRGTTATRLREGGRAGAGLTGSRTRSALVVVQVALSLTLLVGAGLLTRAFVELLRADPGFDGRDVLTLTVSLNPADYPSDVDVADFDGRFRAAVSALPGVVSVGAADELPLTAQASQTGVGFPGAPGNTGDEEEDSPLTDYMMITPGYAEAAGMRLLEGRLFDERDGTDAPRVALVDDLLAHRFYPAGGALGKPLVIGGDTLTVVGIVDQARHYTVRSDDRPQLYVPLAQNAVAALRYAVAGTGDPAAYAPEIRRVLDDLAPAVPMSDVGTLRTLIDASLAGERLSLTLLAAFAMGALLLATLGIYGVVSNAVSARTHEVGVRMALGAERTSVLRLILGQGVRLTLWGSALGLVGAAVAARVLDGVMPGIDPFDPVVFAAVTALLAGVTGLAAWIPALGATRIAPTEALRGE